ncbi:MULTISPECIES: hypothetical protein [Paraburkholderia]|uniref:hypothetical protein n=1 Tax=Paraburkholderia TaxID=1822464 RepID=UPI00225838D7|nr:MULTISPECIES: hypothetical protein [Paraburkholderia]MCX4156165.1 hypothetical protein [Paraburkholderia aspalathi]MDN7165571.1 hypothetical protein [Paraburkholderia sp. SECH2]MDQ6394057.1 hypothetical protein [Paraburkholderia aspalathi]
MPLTLKRTDRGLVETWHGMLDRVFPESVPETARWVGLPSILAILEALSGTTAIHVFLPESGGQDLGWVQRSSEPGCLEFAPETEYHGHRAYIAKVLSLDFRVPTGNLLEAHFVLHTDSLQAKRSDTIRMGGVAEEVLNLGDGEYVERYHLDQGHLENGRELPEERRLEIRYLRPARFAIFSKVSAYNRVRLPSFNAYGGVHEDASSFDAIVDRLSQEPRSWED